MIRLLPGTALLFILLAACGQETTNPAEPENAPSSVAAPDYAAEAKRIAQESIIVDTHIDVPYRLEKAPADVSVATADGDFDYPRAVAGGLNAPFMSIFTPASLEPKGESFAVANRLIDIVEEMVAGAPDKFAIALSPDDVRQQFEQGLISLPLGMENGSPIEGKLANVEYFYNRGIRYITLAHGKSNHISDSSYDENRQWDGLSDFGAELVREMNRLGIMVDISHVSDEAFYETLEITEVPVIASHSSARHFTPGFERNMDDDMIRKLAENGGAIMINYGSSFVTEEANRYASERSKAEKAYASIHPGADEDYLEKQFAALFAKENGPYPFADLDDVLDHIDHAVALAGIDHVGIGSDYDGVGDSLPIGLKDVASYPALVEGLLERGYSEADIRKILGENLLRIWAAVEDHANSGA